MDELAGEEHFGLKGMEEMADEIGGQLQLVSEPGEGTLVRVLVPVLTEATGRQCVPEEERST